MLTQKDIVSTTDSMCAEAHELWYNVDTKGHCVNY